VTSTALTDLRTGGTWSAAQRLKNDAIWLAASLALGGLGALPPGALSAAGRGLGRVAHLLAADPRRTARANVARIFPDLGAAERDALVHRSFVTLGGLLGETVASLRGELTMLHVTDEARATLAEAMGDGRGVVFPSAHLGPWEHVAASLVAARVPLVTLARESYDPRFSRLYDRLRGARGVGVVWRASPGAAARILRTLRAGRVLGMPMDLRSRVPSCVVPFLGHPAPTAIGPARIALRTGAPVVVGTAAPDGVGSWCVTATRIDTADLDAGEPSAVELTSRINAELSRRILAAPHGWVWMHDRWDRLRAAV
jgi:KDO2-lipid IV(A) lauroyltransferase